MASPSIKQFKNILRLRAHPEHPGEIDVELNLGTATKSYDSMECHLVLYPYSRNIDSNDFSFLPFEEYVADILESQRSAYVAIKNHFDKGIGVFLAILIMAVFVMFFSTKLFSVEILVSVIGAYIIGKELGSDLETILIDLSSTWPIRFREKGYMYHLEKNTTLTFYSSHAKRHRYGRESLIPQKMDYIPKSNSETVRMYFTKDNFTSIKGSAHILTIQVKPELMEELRKGNYLFGLKLSFNKDFLKTSRSMELFQSLDNNKLGCLDERGQWHAGAVFYRFTFRLNRLKIFLSKGLLKKKTLIIGKI